MKGYLTSFVGLFEQHPVGGVTVRTIEIPLIQRDYAQGRRDASVDEIRTNFLEVLIEAASGGSRVGLDFVYGNVEGSTLRPLDGQQRLTTLFLLHWYLASRAGRLDAAAPWTRFSYATRPSARLFCKRLVEHPLPSDADRPSRWLTDQEWYLHLWTHDPTIQAMLVMVDAIHDHVATAHPGLDAQAAWARLTDPDAPAISFYLLPLDNMTSDEDLYIKMNSRGKPLTPFENFKARFEQDISDSPRAGEFAHKIDGAWSDLLWPYHGGDNIVDDEFMRYLDFVIETCELREHRVVRDRLGRRARTVFGKDNPRAPEHLEFLFHSFDTWEDGAAVASRFADWLSTAEPRHAAYDSSKVLLFGATTTNLFEQCCHTFDSQLFGNRAFTLQQSLLLYAVLLHRATDTPDFNRRLRVLRNLMAASENEVRRENMPALMQDVEGLVTRGDLGAVRRFSSSQAEDERLKREFLDANPSSEHALFRLEDHSLLRGTLSAFDFDPGTFERRAQAFEVAFSDPSRWGRLTAGLLTVGEYQRRRPKSESWQFGTGSAGNDGVWRYLLTAAPRKELEPTRRVLGTFLDGLVSSGGSLDQYVDGLTRAWLDEREAAETYDWRYYLVRYDAMREGASGIYYGERGALGYSMCMLRKTQLNSYYRDPVLLAVWRTSGVAEHALDPWFMGYAIIPRWLRLARSDAGIRSVPGGFQLRRPDDAALADRFDEICVRHGCAEVDGVPLLRVAQKQGEGGVPVDTVNRVEVGAALLVEMVRAGL